MPPDAGWCQLAGRARSFAVRRVMPAASRHAKPKPPANRLRALVAAVATLAGVAAAFVFLHGGSATPGPSHHPVAVTSAGSGLADNQVTATVHHTVASVETRTAQRATPSPGRSTARRSPPRGSRRPSGPRRSRRRARPPRRPPPRPRRHPAGGGNAASSALGVCIRNAEEGGSYAWGPGNGGGAYQFLLGTWEHYGGAASAYGLGRSRLPGSDLRQRYRRRWRIELDGLRRVLTGTGH